MGSAVNFQETRHNLVLSGNARKGAVQSMSLTNYRSVIYKGQPFGLGEKAEKGATCLYPALPFYLESGRTRRGLWSESVAETISDMTNQG